MEAEEKIKMFPGEKTSIDNFGENPFGSRRFIIIPIMKSVVPSQMEKRPHSPYTLRENYLLIEMDTPFESIGRDSEFFVECMCRQVGPYRFSHRIFMDKKAAGTHR